MTCYCKTSMDIRGRCDIKTNSFLNCPARIDTILFQFENNYDNYKMLEKNPTQYKEIIQKYCKKYKMKNEDIVNVITLYLENLPSDEETEE